MVVEFDMRLVLVISYSLLTGPVFFFQPHGFFFSTSFFSFFHLTQLTRTLLGFWMDQLHFTETDGADETLKKVGRLTL